MSCDSLRYRRLLRALPATYWGHCAGPNEDPELAGDFPIPCNRATVEDFWGIERGCGEGAQE